MEACLYLNEIRIYGFKSFPDPINLRLNRGITGFVGPNGSGKSNVVDAIRWVLGEQSSKELRASVMDDLIFNGTYKRKPSNLSDVSLKFINEGELELSFAEIEFERKLYRTGESQYLINRESVRLKDVQKLLLEAGMGVKSYSLFKRSLIDEIVNGKADALRNLFEESAGISQYKAAKKETLRKLIHTQEDLYRVDDLIAEIEKQHRDLKNQANRANRYNKYKVVVENLNQYVLKQRILKYDEQIERINGEMNSRNERINIINKDLEDIRSNLNEYKEKRKIVSKSLNEAIEEKENIQEKTYAIGSEIKILEQNITHENENIAMISANREKQIGEQPIRKQRLQQYADKKADLILKKDQIEKQMSGTEDDNIEVLYRNNEREFNSLKEERRKKRNKMLILQSENSNLNYKKENILDQFNDKSQERKTEEDSLILKKDELHKTEETLNKMKANMQLLKEQSNELNKLITAKENERRSVRDSRETSKHKLIENNAYINQLKERMKESSSSLEDLEKTLNKELMLMRNQIKPAEKYEHYVKYALSYFINSIVMKRDDVDSIMNADTGMLSFILENDLTGKHNEANSLDNYVEAPDYIKQIFSHFIIVEHDDDIFEKSSNAYYINSKGLVKTPAGFYIKSGETDILNFKESIKEREQENLKTEEILKNQEAELKSLNTKLEDLNTEKENIIRKITENEQRIDFTGKSVEAINMGIRSRDSLISKFDLLLIKMKEETELIEKKISSNNDEINSMDKELKETEAFMLQREDEFNKIKEEFIIYSNRKNELERLFKDINDEIALLQDESEQLSETIERAVKEIEESEYRIEQIKEKITEESKRAEKKAIEQSEIQELLISSSGKVKELEAGLADIELQLEEFQESEDQKQKITETLREERSDFRVEQEKYITEKEMDKQYVDEDFEIDYELIEKHRDSAEDELVFLKEKMIRMEPINQLAFQEFQEVSERLDEMNSQKNDIVQAKENLEKTIKTLDAKAKTIFVQYFDTIRTNFRELFYDIFKSGHADIILEDEKNPLDCEIQIIFEPREKKVDKLVMLSDGERAMMVISLLFSMYMVRPTPVCIMDEIDGPLDDANVENFIQLLKRFRDKTQFILITHNKRTMEFCDYLFGVTMEESGVTNIVSLNLQTMSSKFLKDDVQEA